MPEGGLERRLERIEARQDTMLETLAVIRQKVEQTNGSVADIAAEIGRVPAWETRGDRLPITDRIHAIEAVISPVALTALITDAMSHKRASTWTAGQKVLTMSAVLVGTVFTVLRFAGYGG